MIPDWLYVKYLEKTLKRRLTLAEIYGLKRVTVTNALLNKEIRVPQVSIQWLHNKNSCK